VVGILDIGRESRDERLEMVVKEGGEPVPKKMGLLGLSHLLILGSL